MKSLYTLFLMSLLFACATPNQSEKTDTPATVKKEKQEKERVQPADGEVDILNENPIVVQTSGNAFITGRRWQDANGDNLLVFTYFDEITSHPSGDEAISRSLYVEHFAQKEDGADYELIRKIQDFEKECILENMLNLEEKSVNVTNLDHDEFKEISFVYTLGCRSDLSTDPMKLMMLENGEKYAVRGNTRSKYLLTSELGENATFPESTDKTFDPSFEKAPTAFKEFANNLWNSHELKK